MKKEVRKSVARQKNYVTGTGGGPFIREEKLSPALEQLHQNIKISSDGLICPFDSDSIDISSNYYTLYSLSILVKIVLK